MLHDILPEFTGLFGELTIICAASAPIFYLICFSVEYPKILLLLLAVIPYEQPVTKSAILKRLAAAAAYY